MAAASAPSSDPYSARFGWLGRCKLSAFSKTWQCWARPSVPQMIWSQCQLDAFLRIWRFVRLALPFPLWSSAGIWSLANAVSFFAWLVSCRFQISVLVRLVGAELSSARGSACSGTYSGPPKFIVSCFAANLAYLCLKRSLLWPQNVSVFTAVTRSQFQLETNPIELK